MGKGGYTQEKRYCDYAAEVLSLHEQPLPSTAILMEIRRLRAEKGLLPIRNEPLPVALSRFLIQDPRFKVDATTRRGMTYALKAGV